MVTEEAAVVETTPKRRGKPNPLEAQIQDAINRYDAKSDEPITVTFPSPATAEKGRRNLYQALRSRGYKPSIAVEGANVTFRVVGMSKAKRRGAAKKVNQKARTVKGGKRTKATAAARAGGPATSVSGTKVLVRVKAGRGWAYTEYTTKAEAEAALYALDGSGSVYEVYERKAITVKKTVEGW